MQEVAFDVKNKVQRSFPWQQRHNKLTIETSNHCWMDCREYFRSVYDFRSLSAAFFANLLRADSICCLHVTSVLGLGKGTKSLQEQQCALLMLTCSYCIIIVSTWITFEWTLYSFAAQDQTSCTFGGTSTLQRFHLPEAISLAVLLCYLQKYKL